MLLQKQGNFQSVLIMPLHANVEGFHTAVQHGTSVGVEGSPEVDQFTGAFFYQFTATDYSPCQYVRVAVQVLGTAVQGQIKAGLRRPVVNGAGEGVVDHADQIVIAGEGYYRIQV